MKTISLNKLKLYLKEWINIDNLVFSKPLIPFLHGKAGIGKTQIVEELAKEFNKELIILNLSHQEEGDLIGIPKIIENKTIWTKPEWMIEKENVILFLDEIDRAPKNILNAILTLLREYRIHTHYLNKKWKIIAAGNSGFNDDFYDIQELDNALSSRFVHFFVEINPKEWLKWAKKKGFNKTILKYIETKPEHLLVENTENFSFAYPNPRTWEYLNENLKILNILNDDILTQHTIVGTIGEKIGNDFFVFYKTYNQINYATFNEIYNNFNIFKDKDKEFYTNTILNLNIKMILKSLENYDKKKVINLLTKMIILLGNLKYYELAFLLTNKIEISSQKLIERIIEEINKNPEYKSIFNQIRKNINN